MIRRLRIRARAERGSSMVEVMVTCLLLSIVLAFVFGGVASLQNALAGTERRVVNLNEARVLMATSSKDLRTAVRLQAGTSPFLVADAREVRFYGNINPTTGPKYVRIYVDAQSQLVEEVTTPDVGSVPPNYTYTGQPLVRFVGRYVANTAQQPLFRYYDQDGIELTSVPLSSADRLSVYSVKITMVIRKTTTLPIVATTLENRVRLPNLDYRVVAG